jgi:hypothetical protein
MVDLPDAARAPREHKPREHAPREHGSREHRAEQHRPQRERKSDHRPERRERRHDGREEPAPRGLGDRGGLLKRSSLPARSGPAGIGIAHLQPLPKVEPPCADFHKLAKSLRELTVHPELMKEVVLGPSSQYSRLKRSFKCCLLRSSKTTGHEGF